MLHSSRRYYARRARYWDLFAQRQRADRETPRELDLLEHVFKTNATRPIRRVLDIACGGGRHVVGLAKRGYKCTGYDLTPERVEMAKARAKRAGISVELKQGDATKLPKDRKFDAILALYILFLLPSDEDVKSCLRQIRNSLLPGGIIVCNFYNPFTTGKHWMVDAIRQGHTLDESRVPGIRITEIGRLNHYDPVRGIASIDETTIVEAADGRHLFRDREHFRLLTYWDLTRYLNDTGFKAIEAYSDWDVKPKKKPKAEQIVLVARR